MRPPRAIGIEIDDPAVKRFHSDFGTDYGGIDPRWGARNRASRCSPHAADGVIHTESAITSPNTLGQFFIEWGVALDAERVGGYREPVAPIEVFVDGEPYSGDPGGHRAGRRARDRDRHRVPARGDPSRVRGFK